MLPNSRIFMFQTLFSFVPWRTFQGGITSAVFTCGTESLVPESVCTVSPALSSQTWPRVLYLAPWAASFWNRNSASSQSLWCVWKPRLR